MKVSGRGSLPLILNNLPMKTELVKHFVEDKFVVFDYTGAVDVSEVLSQVITDNPGADAVTNVVFELKSNVGTFFANLFTLGIANARVIQVEGDLIKIPGGLKAELKDKKFYGSFDLNKEIKVDSRILGNYVFVKNNNKVEIYY
jgi:hypothetical protein